MGQILLGQIKNRVGFGLKRKKKKKPEACLGRVRVLVKTLPKLRPGLTWLANVKLQKKTYLYIYHNPNPKTHFSLN